MKKMKRFVALALSVVMVLAMSVMAFADGTSQTFTITAPDNKHTYEVYQIFTGKLTSEQQENGETKQILSDIKWGKNGTGREGTTVDSATLDTIKNVTGDDTAKLEVISNYVNLDAKKIFGHVSNNNNNLNVPAGYYLIKDVDGSQANKDDSYTKYIVRVVGDITIAPKADKPSVEKKVQENKKYQQDNNDYGTGYNDTADYSIGDDVPFELIGTVPDMSQYKKYTYTFHDTLSKAFDDVSVDNIKVYLAKTKNDKNPVDIKQYFTEDKGSISSENGQITVSTKDLKSIEGILKGYYIIVKYSAKLNSNAAIGQGIVEGTEEGNINKVYLTYSNNPNQNGEGTPEEGRTPDDQVIVFTYKLDTTKVDGADTSKKLKDVTFKLYKKVTVNETEEKKEWAQVTNGKLSGWIDNEEGATKLKSDVNGLFSVTGLDDGTYYLREVETLPGYNKLEKDVEVVITANTSNGQSGKGQVKELTKIEVKADNEKGTGTASTGTAEITIANNKGSNLPSTGGIGTTIFYIVGGILMVGAAVLLITKRRAEN